KQITPNLAQAEVISLQHVADRLRRPIDLTCDLFDRSLHKFLANDLKLGLCPSSMVLLSLDSVLDDEAPARLLRPPAVALQADHKLLKFGSRKHFGRSSHGHGFCTPLWGALRQFGESCHMRLDNRCSQGQEGHFRKWLKVRHVQTGESSLVPSMSRSASDGRYSLWSRRHVCRVEDQSVPPDPGESCPAPLRSRIRSPIPTKGTPQGVLWQPSGIFSGLNAKKVVHTPT